LRELEIDEAWIHEVVRRMLLHDQAVFTSRTFLDPTHPSHGGDAARQSALEFKSTPGGTLESTISTAVKAVR
jgi:hypothetical protein